MTSLILTRASVSRPSGHWQEDDYDVLENGVVAGRIFCLDAVRPQGRPCARQPPDIGCLRVMVHLMEPVRLAQDCFGVL
jgi:hypothetical protein